MNFVNVFMQVVNGFSAWLTHIGLQDVVDQHAWIVPACQTIHFVGLAMLMAGIALFDLQHWALGRVCPSHPCSAGSYPSPSLGFSSMR
jgi:hypothetical protein